MQSVWAGLIGLASVLGQVPAETHPAVSFEIPDSKGKSHSLSEWQDRQAVVIIFLGTDCPLAKLYAPRLKELAKEFGPRGVGFIGIDANQHDSPAAISQFAAKHQISFPILKDSRNRVADQLGAQRTPEVFLLDRNRQVRYRGRIDDQYIVGVHRSAATSRDLATAIEELLANKPISNRVTKATGCIIDRHEKGNGNEAVTYCREIAPILQRRCQYCHRPGQIGPFSLTTFDDAAGWSEMIREVVGKGRMPPWHAHPGYGRFSNDSHLSEREKQLIQDWVEEGTPEGNPADLPPLAGFADEWNISKPDLVLTMPQKFKVPAEGVIEYQSFVVDPGFQKDVWVRAAEIRPGNRKVVHHCTVFLQPPGSNDVTNFGNLGSYCLVTAGPGTPPLALPAGMAKVIPAGWRLVFVVHYTAIGSVEEDQTSLGLVLADPAAVKKEVATQLVYDNELRIPPRVADHRIEMSWPVGDDILLFSLFPHMHLRGKSFRYEADYPDGTTEVLLEVPRFDFKWQNQYVFAEPKWCPAGTVFRCIAHYDNSANNPANPDPSATVVAGQQSWDEMFNGYFEWALADQDMTRPSCWKEKFVHAMKGPLRPASMGIASVLAIFLLARRSRPTAGKGDIRP